MIRAKKRLGQHFLRSQAVLEEIVQRIQPQKTDHFVELGAGDGSLTLPLLQAGACVAAMELDPDCIRRLENRHAAYAQTCQPPPFRLLQGDITETDWRTLIPDGGSCRLVGNLPYNISSSILAKAMQDTGYWQDAHFLVQREMAERITAAPGQRHWGRLGVLAHCSVATAAVLEVPPEAFSPPPRVQSSLLHLKPQPEPAVCLADRPFVETAARLVFSSRRKSLRNSLRKHIDEEGLRQLGLDPTKRAEQIGFEELCVLAGFLQKADG